MWGFQFSWCNCVMAFVGYEDAAASGVAWIVETSKIWKFKVLLPFGVGFYWSDQTTV